MSDCGKKSKGKDNPAYGIRTLGFGLSVVSVIRKHQSDEPTPNGHAKFESEKGTRKNQTRDPASGFQFTVLYCVGRHGKEDGSAHLDEEIDKAEEDEDEPDVGIGYEIQGDRADHNDRLDQTYAGTLPNLRVREEAKPAPTI